jgi:hypothetical protein
MSIPARPASRNRPCSTLGSAIALAILCCGAADAAEVRLAAMTSYSASGTHQCNSDKGGSCVVSGTAFSNCNDAASLLRTRDCCPTSGNGGQSRGFTLNYCLPEAGIGR